MVDSWQKFNTWVNVKKMILLIVAIAIIFLMCSYIIVPLFGATIGFVMFFVFLLIAAFLIRIWGKGKL